MCIKRNINHNVSEDAATAAIISIFAAMWQAATTGQTNSAADERQKHSQHTNTCPWKHTDTQTHTQSDTGTHTTKDWERPKVASALHMQHVRIPCNGHAFEASEAPLYHNTTPQILATCRCYWDKEIYWLRMFFVTDFDLCAFMCSDFFHSGFI